VNNKPEKFEDIVHEQFSVSEKELHSSTALFPRLDPETKLGLLAVNLQIDSQHGTISSISVGQRLIDDGEKLANQAAEAANHRLNTFRGFHEDVVSLLEEPGDDPEPAILYIGGSQALVKEYPGDLAYSPVRFEWAVHLACRHSLDAIGKMEEVGDSTRSNLNSLVQEIFVLSLFDRDKNSEAILG
jgi:hypothetical protein